jgi:hypothetical protein
MAGGWGKGSTRAWRRVRATVLARDGNLCQLRLPGCTRIATCVHHVYGRAVTGDDPRWLAAACQHCNLRIGQPGRPRGRRRTRTTPQRKYTRW